MKPLIGYQLPLLSGVSPYLVSNPAACTICSQQRTAKGLTGSCPVCEWHQAVFELGLSPERSSGGLYTLSQDPTRLIVTEQPPDYSQRPLSPEQAFAIGDEVRILAVQEHQTKRWIGQRAIVHKLSRTRVLVKLKGFSGGKLSEVSLPVEYLEKLPTLRRRPQRRYSPKGTASGWLEERQGNKKRKTASISYYYGWLETGKKRKCYVPVGKVHRVHDMITKRQTVTEILSFLGVQQPPADHD